MVSTADNEETKALTEAVKRLTTSVDELINVLAVRMLYSDEERTRLFQEYQTLRSLHTAMNEYAEKVSKETEDRSLRIAAHGAVKDAWAKVLEFQDAHRQLERIAHKALGKRYSA